jgi:hypothetical protein
MRFHDVGRHALLPSALLISAAFSTLACGSDDAPPQTSGENGGTAGTGGGAAGTSGGSGGSAGTGLATGAGGSAAGSGGASGSSGSAGNGGGGAAGGSAGASSAGTAGSSGGTGPVTVTCGEAAAAYTVSITPFATSLVPYSASSSWGSSLAAQRPASVHGERLYVGFTTESGDSRSAVAVGEDGSTLTVPDAVLGGIAATSDGAAMLLFDPNTNVDERTWAAVVRLRADGTQTYLTDLFRSPNLEDVDTKGAPGSGRLGYVAAPDQVVAYFGHTQRYDDGVRHQGGYLATVGADGAQEILSDWFGSHNLDQRLFTDASGAAVLGLGDAYPEGIFFSFLNERPRAAVLYPLAAAGNGATNGQLGGGVDLDDELLVPFITNDSIPQDLDAGTWPDIDETIADQIREAAANGTDLGFLLVPKNGTNPDAALEATFVDTALTEGARLERLKAARYGSGDLVLLAWAETTGGSRDGMSQYFTMVIDREGAVCQPKTPLAAELAFSGGDDIVRRPNGAIVWSVVQDGVVSLVTLTPG